MHTITHTPTLDIRQSHEIVVQLHAKRVECPFFSYAERDGVPQTRASSTERSFASGRPRTGHRQELLGVGSQVAQWSGSLQHAGNLCRTSTPQSLIDDGGNSVLDMQMDGKDVLLLKNWGDMV